MKAFSNPAQPETRRLRFSTEEAFAASLLRPCCGLRVAIFERLAVSTAGVTMSRRRDEAKLTTGGEDAAHYLVDDSSVAGSDG